MIPLFKIILFPDLSPFQRAKTKPDRTPVNLDKIQLIPAIIKAQKRHSLASHNHLEANFPRTATTSQKP
ncbi:hypothetical protein NIES208_06500 [[Limnothrix rosea] IAM M-220]|nr:hypothetical protein NIES208_06500 [[Limnothrix rosea] IAM M-220]